MIKKIIHFLIHPRIDDTPTFLGFKESMFLVSQIVLLYYGLAFIGSLFIVPILKQLNSFPEVGKSLSEISISFKLLIFVPIYEELIFRLPLRFSKYNIFTAIAALQYLLLHKLLSLTIIICISAIIISIPFLWSTNELFHIKIKKLWSRNFSFLYFGFALAFGTLHMFNFVNLKLSCYLLFPLIVFNQIVMGLLLGYVRINYKYGIIYSIMTHFLINLPLVLIAHMHN